MAERRIANPRSRSALDNDPAPLPPLPLTSQSETAAVFATPSKYPPAAPPAAHASARPPAVAAPVSLQTSPSPTTPTRYNIPSSAFGDLFSSSPSPTSSIAPAVHRGSAFNTLAVWFPCPVEESTLVSVLRCGTWNPAANPSSTAHPERTENKITQEKRGTKGTRNS